MFDADPGDVSDVGAGAPAPGAGGDDPYGGFTTPAFGPPPISSELAGAPQGPATSRPAWLADPDGLDDRYAGIAVAASSPPASPAVASQEAAPAPAAVAPPSTPTAPLPGAMSSPPPEPSQPAASPPPARRSPPPRARRISQHRPATIRWALPPAADFNPLDQYLRNAHPPQPNWLLVELAKRRPAPDPNWLSPILPTDAASVASREQYDEANAARRQREAAAQADLARRALRLRQQEDAYRRRDPFDVGALELVDRLTNSPPGSFRARAQATAASVAALALHGWDDFNDAVANTPGGYLAAASIANGLGAPGAPPSDQILLDAQRNPARYQHINLDQSDYSRGPRSDFAAPLAHRLDVFADARTPPPSGSDGIGHIVGSVLPYIASGPAAPFLMAAAGAHQAEQDAEAKGLAGTPQADRAVLGMAALNAVAGVVPVADALEPLVLPMARGPVTGWMLRQGLHGLGGAATGGGLALGENAIERQTIDPNRPWGAEVRNQALGFGALSMFGSLGARRSSPRRIAEPGDDVLAPTSQLPQLTADIGPTTGASAMLPQVGDDSHAIGAPANQLNRLPASNRTADGEPPTSGDQTSSNPSSIPQASSVQGGDAQMPDVQTPEAQTPDVQAPDTKLSASSALATSSDAAVSADIPPSAEAGEATAPEDAWSPGNAAASATEATDSLAPVTRTVGKNEVTWHRNTNGDTVKVSGILRESFSKTKRSFSELAAQARAGARGILGDEGGHLTAHSFVKDQGDINMFAQNANLNKSAYKTLENDYRRATRAGNEVHFSHTLGDFDANGRAGSIEVEFKIFNRHGKMVDNYKQKLSNSAGQIYKRRVR